MEGDAEVLEALELGGSGRRRSWPRWVAAGGLLLGLVGAVWVAGRGGARHDVELAEVTRGDLAIAVEAVGTLEPLHEVEIGPELSGIVSQVLVEANQRVSAGDVLAVLDTSLLEAQADQADADVATSRASLRQAELQAESARLDRERAEQLAGSGGVPRAEVDRLRLAHEAQVAAVQLAQAQLQRSLATQRVAYTNLEKAVLRSPTDGVVLERNVDPGQAVVSSLQMPVLFRVAEDLDHMSLVIEIDEADIARVHAGQQGTFTVAAWPDQTFEAVVHTVRLAPIPGVDVVTYEAELDVGNVEGLLRPGMSASARLVAERIPDVVLVPNAALRFDPPSEAPPERPHVWVDEGGALSAVVVDPGATDGRQTAVQAERDLVGARVAVGLREKR